MTHRYFKQRKPLEKRIGESGLPLIEELNMKYGVNEMLNFYQADIDILKERIKRIDVAIETLQSTKKGVVRKLKEKIGDKGWKEIQRVRVQI